jgi:hypothetical protein
MLKLLSNRIYIYVYETKNDIIYIITTLIGLIGGLSRTLLMIVLFFVKFFRKFLLKRNSRRIRIMIITLSF